MHSQRTYRATVGGSGQHSVPGTGHSSEIEASNDEQPTEARFPGNRENLAGKRPQPVQEKEITGLPSVGRTLSRRP